jgi:hypothetical protein
LVEDRGLLKIGRSTNPLLRLKAARTWLPEMRLVGTKPFWDCRRLERFLHEGFASCWYAGEWFKLIDEEARELLVDGFEAFSDTDRDQNSVDFIYWVNRTGMSEFIRERMEQGLSLPKFLHQESGVKKSK